jgi:hypothetical protein
MIKLGPISIVPRKIGMREPLQNAHARCAQIRSCDTEGEELEMWQDILGKIKEGVLQSFDSRVLQYEEDIRKMDAQRTTPGWNYCTFFILKEGLAQSFEHMFLLEDALIQYDELEASFFQMLRGVLCGKTS